MGILDGKNAIIYGGEGGIGAAVARTFAREGAHAHLVGRTQESLEVVASEIANSGGQVDFTLNLIRRGNVQGTPLVDMTADQLLQAIDVGLRSNFITSRAAARHAVKQGSGVVLRLNSAEAALQMIASMAALRRPPRLADVAETAAFLASDYASGITGTMTNVTCGLVLR